MMRLGVTRGKSRVSNLKFFWGEKKMRKTSRFLYILILATLHLSSTIFGFQVRSELKNSEEVRPIETSALVSFENQEGVSFSNFEVATVPAGHACLVHLTIVNKRDTPVPLQQVKASCGCASVRFPVAMILPGERVTGDVLVKLPASTPTGVFTVGLQFSNQGSLEPAAHISLGFPLSGSLSLKNFGGSFEICDPIESWRIPVHFTAPITEKSLVVQKSDSLKDTQVKLVNLNGQFFLEFSVAEKMVSDWGLFGSFRISDSRVGSVAETFVTISKMHPIRINPSVLRFRKQDASKDFLVATAILKITPKSRLTKTPTGNLPGTENGNQEEVVEEVFVTIAGHSQKIKIAPLGSGQIYKLEVAVPEEFVVDAMARKQFLVAETEVSEKNFPAWNVRTSRSSYTIPFTIFYEAGSRQ